MIDALAGAINQIPQNADTGYMQDGLLYCSECQTPKQARINIFGQEKIVYIMCECEQRKDENERLKFKTDLTNEEISRMIDIALPDEEMKNHTFANDNGRVPMTRKARQYAKDFAMHLKNGAGLIFYGSCGTGKSYAAEAIANKLIRDGYPVMITKFAMIAEAASKCGYEERSNYYSGLCKYPLLIIDDVGVEKETEYMMEVINRVVDERERSGKPLIITTNITADEMKNPKSDEWARIWSRLMKRCVPVKFEGADLRKIQFANNMRNMQKYFDTAESDYNSQ